MVESEPHVLWRYLDGWTTRARGNDDRNKEVFVGGNNHVSVAVKVEHKQDPKASHVVVDVIVKGSHIRKLSPRVQRKLFGLKKQEIQRIKVSKIDHESSTLVCAVNPAQNPIEVLKEHWPKIAAAAEVEITNMLAKVESDTLEYELLEQYRNRTFTDDFGATCGRILEALRKPPKLDPYLIIRCAPDPVLTFEKKWQWHKHEYMNFKIDFYVAPGVRDIAYRLKVYCGWSVVNHDEDPDWLPSQKGELYGDTGESAHYGILDPLDPAYGNAHEKEPIAYEVLHKAVRAHMESLLEENMEAAATFGEDSGEWELSGWGWHYGPDAATENQVYTDLETIDTVKLYEAMSRKT